MAKSQKKYLPLPIFLLGLFAIGFGVWSVFKANPPKPIPLAINEVTGSGTVTLAFGAPTSILLANTPTTIPLTIDTGTSLVSAASVVITYDPTKVSVLSVTQGIFLPNTLAAATLTSGKVAFTYAVPANAGGGKTGSDPLAFITVKPSSTNPFTLTFDTGTLVAATNATGNVLKTANPTTYTPVIAVDGGWSDWTVKDPTCGYSGHQTRTCTNPAPTNGGASCTGAASKIYINNPCIIPGDFNNDFKVDIFDYNLLIAHYGNPYTIFDYNNLIANFGKTSP